MAAKSKIEWTDATWNPVTGCTKVSDGCANCYAESMAKRLQAAGAKRYRNGFKVTCHPEALDEPLRWKKPRRIFVCSMGDLFHEDVPDEFIDRIFDTISAETRCIGSPTQHQYLLLTKRPKRMKQYIQRVINLRGIEIFDLWWWSNIWLGVTAENQKTADERIPILLQIPAAKRFVSLEPMLGGMDLTTIPFGGWPQIDALHGTVGSDCQIDSSLKLDWVIIGAESGPKRRECKIEWVRDVVGQCKAAGIPAFIKQLHINGKLSKNMDDWPEDLRIRQWPE